MPQRMQSERFGCVIRRYCSQRYVPYQTRNGGSRGVRDDCHDLLMTQWAACKRTDRQARAVFWDAVITDGYGSATGGQARGMHHALGDVVHGHPMGPGAPSHASLVVEQRTQLCGGLHRLRVGTYAS